jgi:iron(III) transport system ATP-binding protein
VDDVFFFGGLTMTEIELRGVSKLYGAGGARAVDDVSLSIEPGEFFFLLGPSGCGKTTLLRIVAGLVAPSAGSVLLGGRDVTALPAQKRGTALVFQNYALWPHMTVSQNVQFGPQMKGLPRAACHRLADENLARVQMEAYGARRPNQLSGGQQQRVALARALAAEPACLLLDEPLSNLDARLRLHMRGELRRLVKSAGTTALYVTHDQKEALSMADRIAVMDQGRLVQVGAPEELYRRPANRFVADFLGEANFLEGEVLAPGEPVQVRTAAGVLYAASASGSRPVVGARVLCCVRPEQVRIAPLGPKAPDGGAPAGPPAALAGTIESQTFLGETRQFVVRLGAEATWRVTSLTAASTALAPGQKVQLLVSASDVALLPQE